jgi:hypothetical protein
MSSIVAYEGRRYPNYHVNWGTAALLDGDYLVNTVTRCKMRASELDQLVDGGHLTRLVEPIVLSERVDFEVSFIVIELACATVEFDLLRPNTEEDRGITAHSITKDYAAYAFVSLEAFNAYCERVANRLTWTLLHEDPASNTRSAVERMRLIRAGLVVKSNHPALNALRVLEAPRELRNRDKLRSTQEAIDKRLEEKSLSRFDDAVDEVLNQEIESLEALSALLIRARVDLSTNSISEQIDAAVTDARKILGRG